MRPIHIASELQPPLTFFPLKCTSTWYSFFFMFQFFIPTRLNAVPACLSFCLCVRLFAPKEDDVIS